MHTAYDNGYPTEPSEGKNPYSRCIYCKKTGPEINGQLGNHAEWCEYRTRKELEAKYKDLLALSRMLGEALRDCHGGNPGALHDLVPPCATVDYLGHPGSSWDIMGHPGTSWDLLELLAEFTD